MCKKQDDELQAKAVINFVEMLRGAFESGNVSNELTVYDAYQAARNYVKDHYSFNTDPWCGSGADVAKFKSSTESKLQSLINKCKCSVTVSINDHRDAYQTAQKRIEDIESCGSLNDLDPVVRAEMVRTNTIINIQFYDETPIGSYDVYHYDLDKCIDTCLSIVNAGEQVATEKDKDR